MFNLKQGRSRIARILLVLLISVWSFGQTSKGTVAGTVMDASGAAVASATVTLTPAGAPDVMRTVTSGSNGEFRFDALNPGIYTITITAANFGTTKVENLDVRASVVTPVAAKLSIAKVSETITVEGGQAALLQTENGEISHSIGTKEITELPISNLNPVSLALTQPGVTSVAGRDDFTNGTSYSVNGMRPRANNFMMDGSDNNDNSIQGQAFQQINLEAVKEVVVMTNSYAAEFGRGGGSVTNTITKSGTNSWHGGTWWLHSDSGLDALDAYSSRHGYTSRDKGRYTDNYLGFSFGGPVVKDKLFAFGTAQWERYKSVTTAQIVAPTAAGWATLAGFAGNPRVDAFTTAYDGITAPASAGSIPLTAGSLDWGYALRSGIAQDAPSIQYQLRADWNATHADTFAFFFTRSNSQLSPDTFNFPSALPWDETQQAGPSNHAAVTWTHILSPSTVNEFRTSWSNFNIIFDLTPTTLAGPHANTANFTVGDFGWGVPSNMPQGRGHGVYQVQDAMSHTSGNHTIKFGADVGRLIVKDTIPFNSRGTIVYNTGGICGASTCSAFQNFIDDYSGGSNASVDKIVGDPVVRPRMWQLGFYAQDNWKLRPNLTVTYGVRWENQTNPSNMLPFPSVDVNNLANFFTPVRVKDDLNNFAPRVGIAYTPRFWRGLFGDDKTVLRAGYGMFYDVLFTNIVDNTAASAPNAAERTVYGPSSPGSHGVANWSAQLAVVPTLSATAAVTSIASNLVNPFTHQWNAEIQRDLGWNTVATVSYVGTRGQRLFANNEYNPRVLWGARMVAGRGGIALRDNTGDSIYHGLQTEVEHRFSKGLMLRGAYTYSKSIDNASEVFVTQGTTSYPQNEYIQRRGDRSERGLSAFDRRQRLVLSYLYNIPNVPKLNSGALNAIAFIARDWSISGTTSFQSGAADTPTIGAYWDTNGDGRSSNDRPDLGNPTAPLDTWAYSSAWGCTAAGGWCDATAWDDVTPADPNAVHWLIPDPGMMGNVGRGSVINPGRQDWTFSLARSFHMPYKEGHTFSIRMEMFNPFNHRNTGTPSWALYENYFGTFHDVPETLSGNRSIRFWAKYAF